MASAPELSLRDPTSALGNLSTATSEFVRVVEIQCGVKSPHVSVVVPMYEHQKYILDLLKAIGKQQAKGLAFEVVIVDDGSQEEVAEEVARAAAEVGVGGRVVRLPHNRGRATARNVGILNAGADLIAFTDVDCLPAPNWLEEGIRAFEDPAVGVVQGSTKPNPTQRQPFFNHFIEIEHFDGSYSTCNVFYRKEAIMGVGGFDKTITYWEDLDLGWRVTRSGWHTDFARDAVVYHQVIPLSVHEWLRWPLHFGYMPAKVDRYPEYRSYLFLGLWVDSFHALFDLALLSLPLAALLHPVLLALSLPYLVAFPIRYGLKGRWPPVKAALHVAWDAISFGVLLVSSVRHRKLVL